MFKIFMPDMATLYDAYELDWLKSQKYVPNLKQGTLWSHIYFNNVKQ